jgi:hypothetical protein
MILTDILLAIIIAAGIPLIRQILKLSTRLAVLEAEMDILLHHSGLDVPKTKQAIKMNMKEIKQNHGPTTGCINIKELYRDKES